MMKNLLKLLKGARKIAERYYPEEGLVQHYLLPSGEILEIVIS